MKRSKKSRALQGRGKYLLISNLGCPNRGYQGQISLFYSNRGEGGDSAHPLLLTTSGIPSEKGFASIPAKIPIKLKRYKKQ